VFIAAEYTMASDTILPIKTIRFFLEVSMKYQCSDITAERTGYDLNMTMVFFPFFLAIIILFPGINMTPVLK